MKRFFDLIEQCRETVPEWMPWDLDEERATYPDLLFLDVREPKEFSAMHIPGSISVPRGVLEAACEWGFEETVPELVQARARPVLVVCRSGYRSLLAAKTMQSLGYEKVFSLRLGLRGWKDDDRELVDGSGNPVDPELADEYFSNLVRADQQPPES